jgi:hypothetical protein
MESGQEGGSPGHSPSAAALQQYSPSSPSSNAGEEPRDTTDWSANLNGIQQLLADPRRQLAEGPTGDPAVSIGMHNMASTPAAALVTLPPKMQPQSQLQGSKYVGPPRPVPPPQIIVSSATPSAASSASASSGGATTPRAVTSPSSCQSDILAKSKAYVKACQEKKADEIFDSLGDDCLAYGVIKKANAKKHRLMDLKTGEFKYLPEMGSMVTLLDGHQADVIYEANWRAVKANVVDMAERLREKLEVTRVDAVIFCVLDNSIYFAMDDNGDLRPPQRDDNG